MLTFMLGFVMGCIGLAGLLFWLSDEPHELDGPDDFSDDFPGGQQVP